MNTYKHSVVLVQRRYGGETDYDSLWHWQKARALALREYQPQCHLEKFRKDFLLKFPGSGDMYKPFCHMEDYTRNLTYAFTYHPN